MARGGGALVNIDPEILETQADTAAWTPDPEYAALGIRNQRGEEVANGLQSELTVMAKEAGVDAKAVGLRLDKASMVTRIQGMIDLKASGVDPAELTRKIWGTGKSNLYLGDKLVATEDINGLVKVVDEHTRALLDGIDIDGVNV